MKQSEKFWSIAELGATAISVAQLATAIEQNGIYTWDRFGRFLLIGPDNKDTQLAQLKEQILKELSLGWKQDEQDLQYFSDKIHDTLLSDCGWFDSKLPDFDKIFAIWGQKNAGINEQPEKSVIASQSKIYDVLRGLIILKFGQNVLNDLESEHSMKASYVVNKLSTDASVNITSKTLKTYLNTKSNQK